MLELVNKKNLKKMFSTRQSWLQMQSFCDNVINSNPLIYAAIMRETKYDSVDDLIFRLHPILLYQLYYLTL